ncbi:MAG: oligoendopeptidase F [Verrucomicrobia bacterium]|nr:oligoendopeptidase F [Verrucomicrobiota bacterium]
MNAPRLMHHLAVLVFVGSLSAANSSIPDYSQTERSKVPDEFKFNVTDLFKDEAAWRAEFESLAKLITVVDGLAKNWTTTPALTAAMFELVNEFNERGDRLHAYGRLQSDMDLSNPAYTRMQTEFQNLAVGFGAKTAFLAPDILQLGAAQVSAYLKAEPRLAPYRFTLEKILRNREHTLSEKEESLIAQVGLFTDTAAKASGLLKNVDLPNPEVTLADGTQVLLNENNFLKYRVSKNSADRRTVVEAYWKNLRKYENTFAALLDGEMKRQVAFARIYKFPSCLEAALFENNISPDVYRNVISTVRANLAPLHRLLKLKQRMLGLPELNYYDVPAPAAPSVEKLYTYEESQHHILAAMAPLGDTYTRGLQRAFAEHWIDLYPNKGKQGGGYSMGIYGTHPFIKMNYSGRYDDMSTLAHELGHSMHSDFSNAAQPFATAGYAIFIAEIASTFNENMLLTEALKTGTDDRVKLRLLESYLERMRGTIYAQTMLAEFELAMHEQAESGQPLTAEWLKATYEKTYRYYMGADLGIVKADDTIAVSWAAVPHFYRPYYVFQYVTGMVASSALAEAVSTGGQAAAERYLTLLRAGASKFPLDLLREAGVDMSTPAPIEAAIKQFDLLVAEMETLYARLPTPAQ